MAGQAGAEGFRVELESGIAYEEVEGVRVAVDEVYAVIVNGKRCGEIIVMPVNLEEVALGLALSDLGVGDPGRVSVSIGGGWIRVDAEGHPARSLIPGGCGLPVLELETPASHGHYAWSDVYKVYEDFAARTGSSVYRIPVHTTGVYDVEAGRAVIAHDASRHTTVLKAIGLAYKAGLLAGGGRLAAITTARASSDMIIRLALVGIGLLVSMRGPLASGLRAARRAGSALVSNAKREGGRSLVLLAGSLE